MLLTVVKDCGEIWNRLFDHRPFLSGEIKCFIREFEEKKKNREVRKLSEIRDWSLDLADNKISEVSSELPNLNKLNTLLEVAEQTCHTILEGENSYDPERNLEPKRILRKAEWENFHIDLETKYSNINKTFEEKEIELREFYQDLEKKLNLTV